MIRTNCHIHGTDEEKYEDMINFLTRYVKLPTFDPRKVFCYFCPYFEKYLFCRAIKTKVPKEKCS